MIKIFKPYVIFICGVILASQAQAWPKAFDYAKDNAGTGDRKTIDKSNVTGAGVNIPRCDVAVVTDGSSVTEDPYCHRYGLIWQPVLTSSTPIKMAQQIDWDPTLTDDADDDFRLPTIKELIRLVDYDNSDNTKGFTDPLIAYWLQNKCADNGVNGGDCREQNVTLADGSTTALKDGYLISSTYLNVDGVDSHGFAQILGLRIKDGKVVMFESGGKGPVFSNHPNKEVGMLALCMGLIVNDKQEITGGCDFRVNGNDGDGAKSHAADLSIVPVFALLVKDIP